MENTALGVGLVSLDQTHFLNAHLRCAKNGSGKLTVASTFALIPTNILVGVKWFKG